MISSKDLSNILLNKYKSNQLAHFYILENGNSSNSLNLNGWINNFLEQTIATTKNINLNLASNIIKNGHSDILIYKNETGKEYNLKDYNNFQDLFKFQNYTPLELKYKFVIFFNCHLLGTQVLNKFLKVLEEPNNQTIIFFINNENKKLLQTIESRGIVLRISDINKNTPKEHSILKSLPYMELLKNNLTKILEDNNLDTRAKKNIVEKLEQFISNPNKINDFLEKIRENPEMHYQIVKSIISTETESISNFKLKEKFLKELQWFSKSKTFNNSSNERFFSLLNSLNR